MIFSTDTQRETDPNKVGELLREYAFPDKSKGYGCYSNFETRSDFVTVPKNSQLGFEMLGYLDCPDMIQQTIILTNGSVTIAYYWDGDGTLCIKEGSRVVINYDCKKDYRWEWLRI